jgi:hypothetical protein
MATSTHPSPAPQPNPGAILQIGMGFWASKTLLSAVELGQRLRFQPGDFWSDPLPAVEVLIMGHILHDWDLDGKRRLVAKAYAALPPGGALVVYDAMIDDERRRHAFGLLSSLNMLIETPGGFDYTGADCCGWLREAGFVEVRVVALDGLGGTASMAIGVKR